MGEVRVAIVGMGLRYPDASSADEYWENVLAGRQAFRRLPDERMNHEDYFAEDPHVPDRFYSSRAAVLRDYAFDRVAHKVAGSTFRTTDMTHWLALDVAGRALADAGFADGVGVPSATTGVVLGNSLAGEFTRANVMRLRWPYVRRTVAAALTDEGWSTDRIASFLGGLERQYKDPFPPIDEDTLAGGLANTIAGRICNVFDLGGGGFTVDGACSSSLLAVSSAAAALCEGTLDVALAGGVDLSIDPFELIGFAKTGALATGEMKVYDRDSNGFWPGEGCGVVVLMREDDAVREGRRIYASIAGWGVSSDGRGGITRPEAAGHVAAISRAHARAGYDIASVGYFEGHGTGTALGDTVEIEAISAARRSSGNAVGSAVLGTVKGNIGHTKAAAGVAGLIKATLAVHHQVLPPATGHRVDHPALAADDAVLRVPTEAAAWPGDLPLRAGVSAMGFGGVNAHVAVCAAPGVARRPVLDERTREIVTGRQDAEVILLDAATPEDLRGRAADLAGWTGKLSLAELADLAGASAATLGRGPCRAAVVARTPEEAVRRLERLVGLLADGQSRAIDVDGVSYALTAATARIGFLFPGQGSGAAAPAAALPRRFPAVAGILADVPPGDPVATEVAQPRIVAGSLAGLRVLADLGLHAEAACGHSLGELTALHWGGALDERAVRRLAEIRGRVMADASEGGGAMLGLGAAPEIADELCAGTGLTVAGLNGPRQTVVSGPAAGVAEVRTRAAAAGVTAVTVPVSHAFHSPAVAPAARAMGAELSTVPFVRLTRAVVSTVTGEPLHAAEDLRSLLSEQITAPVRFSEAAARVAERSDLLVEVGPGRVLSGLVRAIAPDVPTLALDTDNTSLVGLLRIVGAAFVLGAPVDVDRLFAGRVLRSLPLDGSMTFLASPCESAPALGEGLQVVAREDETTDVEPVAAPTEEGTLALLCRLAAERVELPPEAVHAASHPLDDLHLSSITVGQLVNEVTRALGRPPLSAMPNLATVQLGDLAEMIDELAETARPAEAPREVAGVAEWVRPFAVLDVPAPVPPRAPAGVDDPQADWSVHAPPSHPLAPALAERLRCSGLGDGVLLCLPSDGGADHVDLVLAAAREALGRPNGTRFVVVQHGFGVAGLARTLYLEDPSTRVTVVDLAGPAPADRAAADAAVELVTAEVAATATFLEARHDGTTRTVPRLRAVEPGEGGPPLDPRDVLLVTGGGKGITAECALAIALDTGAALAVVGRSDPAEDVELRENLARMRAEGIRVAYAGADVTDRDAVAGAVRGLEAELGRVSAILHGAGRNDPAGLATLSPDAFRDALAPKVDGLRAVLDAVDVGRLRLLVTFGSIIGRAGLRGEAHYATANDQLAELTRRTAAEHPGLRAVTLEWSVWAGAGMGEKLGVVEALRRDGITPIPTEVGIDVLRRVLADPSLPGTLVVSGRTGGLETLPVERPELPLRRFVDRVAVHYPGIELVTEADLSAGSDPYLADHELDGDLLLPAVLGMEAMAQVAGALLGRTDVPTLGDVAFLRPVVVTPGGTTTVRIAALARDGDTAEVVLRTDATGFAADHFRAVLHYGASDPGVAPGRVELLPVALDPVTELYGGVLFQGKRFQRLNAYRRASARAVVADVGVGGDASWFAPFLPQEIMLCDPGARDTVMHALQCCVPDATLLPERIERLVLASRRADTLGGLVLHALERDQDGDRYTYDVVVTDPDGVAVERWDGLVLRAVRHRDGAGPWPATLLGPLFERGLERTLGAHRDVVVEPDPEGARGGLAARRAATTLAVSRAVGGPVEVLHRADGRPAISGSARTVSAAHGAGTTLALVGDGALACDLESVVERSTEAWAALLGPGLLALAELVAVETAEAPDVARTRVWTAMESVRKTGSMSDGITLDRAGPSGWVVFTTGDARVATWSTAIVGDDRPVVLAALAGTASSKEER